jgi:hypothetical protein
VEGIHREIEEAGQFLVKEERAGEGKSGKGAPLK